MENRLTYIKDLRIIKYKRSSAIIALYRCKCGSLAEVRKQSVKNGHTKSCGCLVKETIGSLNIKHGMYRTRTYRIYYNMLSRCNNPNASQFLNYGGRGIFVCKNWMLSFDNFLKDMGECPSTNHSIDRIDVDGNYELSNCKWSTTKEQNNNRTNNAKYLFQGELLSVTEISRRTGITRSRISNWKNRSKYSNKKIENLLKLLVNEPQ